MLAIQLLVVSFLFFFSMLCCNGDVDGGGADYTTCCGGPLGHLVQALHLQGIELKPYTNTLHLKSIDSNRPPIEFIRFLHLAHP